MFKIHWHLILIVIHSATKYLNGHSDLIGGVVICSQGKPELAEQLLYLQNVAVGSIMNPFTYYVALKPYLLGWRGIVKMPCISQAS